MWFGKFFGCLSETRAHAVRIFKKDEDDYTPITLDSKKYVYIEMELACMDLQHFLAQTKLNEYPGVDENVFVVTLVLSLIFRTFPFKCFKD